MSLTLLVGDKDFTALASNIQLKNVAAGGFASVTFNVKRELDKSLLDEFTDVLVYDSETGNQVGGGRLLEPGRNDDGTWQITCLGEGLASMQDTTAPTFYVDQTMDQWYRSSRTTKRMDASVTVYPNQSDDDPTLFFEGTSETQNAAIGDNVIMINRIAELCGMNIGGIGYYTRSGSVASANWRTQLLSYAAALGGVATVRNDAWVNSISTRIQEVVGGSIAAGRKALGFRWVRQTSTQAITDETWSTVRDIIIRAQIYGADGVLRTSGYTNEYIRPHEVLTDWVVRHCPRLDAQAGVISSISTEQIDQMTYLDGVHGMQLAQDVAEREPGLVWQVWEQGENGRWPFYYVPLPTEIQYEASVDDGFNAPSPSSEIYDEVIVTGKTPAGRDAIPVLRTQVVPSLVKAGFHRRATIPLGSEVWSTAAAVKVGDESLAEHATPPNAGTITFARPIYDRLEGRWVKQCEIRSGGLVRVRGVQPTPDTLNATSPDGLTVFRLVSAKFDDDSNSTVCELDTFVLTESRAIAELSRARIRR